MSRFRNLPLLLLTACCARLPAADISASGGLAADGLRSEYPEIRELSRDDLLFVQLQDGLDDFYQASKQREPPPLPPVGIFTYRRRPSDDLFSLNARLNEPYDTVATLNELVDAADIRNRDQILVPTQPGIFVPDPPRTELQRLILGTRLERGSNPMKLVVWWDGKPRKFSFFPGSSFNEVERAYFLLVLFHFPVSQGSITSRYGPRINPLSGHQEFHGGIDIGAPMGAGVHAARAGVVADATTNAILGKYVVISHPGGYQTVYGHLSAIGVTIGERVATGFVIGAVGMTGEATGPHLHFEVRHRGETRDPASLLARK